MWAGLSDSLLIEYDRNNVCPLGLGHKRRTASSLFSISLITCSWVKWAAMSLRQPYGERNWGLLPRAMWVSRLGKRSSSPSQAFRWLQPNYRSWPRTTQPNCSQISDPPKLWDNKYTRLRQTCSISIIPFQYEKSLASHKAYHEYKV